MIAWLAIFALLAGGMLHDYLHAIKITQSFFAQMMGLFITASTLLTITG